jgi:hypothetical protein
MAGSKGLGFEVLKLYTLHPTLCTQFLRRVNAER